MLDDTQFERFCEDCQEYRPITKFRRRGQSGTKRHHHCNDCHNKRERDRRAMRALKGQAKKLEQFVARLKLAGRPKRVMTLSDSMVARFGGVAKFGEAWANHLHKACQEQPASKFVLESMMSIMVLTLVAEKVEPPLSRMSDEEFRHEWVKEFKNLFRKDPDMLVEVVTDLGWTLIPPTAEHQAEGVC